MPQQAGSLGHFRCNRRKFGYRAPLRFILLQEAVVLRTWMGQESRHGRLAVQLQQRLMVVRGNRFKEALLRRLHVGVLLLCG